MVEDKVTAHEAHNVATKPVPLTKKIVAGALSIGLFTLLTLCVIGMVSWLYFYLLAAFCAVYAYSLQHRMY